MHQAGATGREETGRTAPFGPQVLSLSLEDEDEPCEEPPDEDEPPVAAMPPEDDASPVLLAEGDAPDVLRPPSLLSPLPEARLFRQLSNSSSKDCWRSRLKASQSSSNWRFWRSRHEW